MSSNLGASWRKPDKQGDYKGPAGPRLAAKDRPGVEVHHTVTKPASSPQGLAAVCRAIWRDHVQQRGWSDIFYSYLIGSDGSIAEGRGAGRGTSSKLTPVTIALVGDFRTAKPPKAMLTALVELRAQLLDQGVGEAVTYHRDRDQTACPGDAAVAAVDALDLDGSSSPPKPSPKPQPKPAPPAGRIPWPGRLLRQPPILRGADVAHWQARMRDRGWRIVVDGAYGPDSEAVCRAFQAEKRREGYRDRLNRPIAVDGIVGPVTWDAAWEAPVT